VNGRNAAEMVIRLSVRFTDEQKTDVKRRAAMTWAQLLKRVFEIDIETYRECGGAVRVIACIEDPVVIAKILSYRKEKAPAAQPIRLPESRVPPHTGLFD
jgi:hypothetical protein